MNASLIRSLLKRLATLIAALCSPVCLRAIDGMPLGEALRPLPQPMRTTPHSRAEGRGQRFGALAARAVAGRLPRALPSRAAAARTAAPADAGSDEAAPGAAVSAASRCRAVVPGVAGAARTAARQRHAALFSRLTAFGDPRRRRRLKNA